MATMAAATVLSPAMVRPAEGASKAAPKKGRGKGNGKRRGLGDFSHFSRAVRKDVEFLSDGVSRGLKWANKAFRIPEVSKAVDEVVWLRNLEDSDASLEPPSSWPEPSYAGAFEI